MESTASAPKPVSDFWSKVKITGSSSFSMIKCRVSDCTDLFDTESAHLEHFRSHEKLFSCSLCNALCTSKDGVFKHFDDHHPQVAGRVAVRSGPLVGHKKNQKNKKNKKKK